MPASFQDTVAPSWFSPLDLDGQAEPLRSNSAFLRLWRGFMTARVMIALALLLLQVSIYVLGQAAPIWLIALCVVYLVETLWVRLRSDLRSQGRNIDPQWLSTIGVDSLAFTVLQLPQTGGINYAPLYALPVLLAAVLGSRSLALGTASGVTLLLLLNAGGRALLSATENPFLFFQAGLTGMGLLVIAWLANELATRLAGEERTARRNQIEAHAHRLVNDLVIENLTDGLLVVDNLGVVRAANPAARRLLGQSAPAPLPPFTLHDDQAWEPLARLARQTYDEAQGQTADILIQHADHARCHAQARTRLTPDLPDEVPSLCVMFLQDLREMEARLRTEKLASMGRMSAAVAHEIRNPLAAISQANALLTEDLNDPHQRQLTDLVNQNVRRLAQIVDEVLEVARVPQGAALAQEYRIGLDPAVAAVCQDWANQTECGDTLQLTLDAHAREVSFAPDHLRRVMVNLLDNAMRHASRKPGAIRVDTQIEANGQAKLRVWSDGAPIETAVQRHLFEPFFSSQSRSSGLGLFICRQLCQTHGAVIGHARANRRQPTGPTNDGNEFYIAFRQPEVALPGTLTKP